MRSRLACVVWILLIASRVDAAWAYKVGSAANGGDTSGGVTPIVATLGVAVASGDRVIVTVSLWRTTLNPSVVSVSDGVNTYTLDATTGVFTQDPGFPQLVSVYSFPFSGIATPAVSVSYIGDAGGIAIAAYSGLSTAAGAAAGVDVSAVANSFTDPTATVTTGATTGANELALGAYGDDGSNQTTHTATGFTQRTFRQSSTDADVGLYDADSGSSGATPSFGVDLNSAQPAGVLLVVYKLSGGGATCSPTLSLRGVSSTCGH